MEINLDSILSIVNMLMGIMRRLIGEGMIEL